MRLTKQIRNLIIQLVTNDVQSNRAKDIQSRRTKLANDVYDFIYGPYKKQIEALPPTAFRTYSYVDVKFGFSSDCLYLGEEKLKFYSEPTEMRTLAEDHKLTLEWQAIQKDKDQLRADVRRVNQEVGAILNSVTTDKRLLEVWPEGAHWITKAIPESCTTTLPAVQIENVNKMLCQLIGKNSPTCEDK